MIRDTYLTLQDPNGAVRSFHDLKTQWGFSQFLSLETFKEASNGYLVGDSCIFGAEVFVIKSTGKWESLTMIENPPIMTFTWKMQSFSKLDQSIYYSDAFTVGESRWKLQVYPKGYGSLKGKSFSVFLLLLGNKDFPPKRKVYRECNLRVLDQLNDNHMERKNSSRGYTAFVPLEDLQKPAKGFIYEDVLIVQVQILIVSSVKVVGVR
ncbi:ubiquitin C-terminal hydrolase 13-like [Syzygium oleosum]|uniref:ubiquitin C-terminal hydrolase 13-like n=1 Tax=Syzygium oleosum TaxID=219896 RepID=UPI0024BAE318|nr:ubiquitin C-terminal hydrolase 13-like [Syzygium oleosum]